MKESNEKIAKCSESSSLSYLTDVFPPKFGVYDKIADRLNQKGLKSPYRKKYSRTIVYQAIITPKEEGERDMNAYKELLQLIIDYKKELEDIKELEKQALLELV